MAENDDVPPVGFKRPPKVSQFKPGQSGNPKGRPRGARNFATALDEELKARIAVTENGKRRMISKRQAVAKQLVNKAVTGDPRAIPILLNEARLHESQPGTSDGPGIFDTPEDRMVMGSIIQRIRAAEHSAPAPGSQSSGRRSLALGQTRRP
jgi:hypothetical protein